MVAAITRKDTVQFVHSEIARPKPENMMAPRYPST